MVNLPIPRTTTRRSKQAVGWWMVEVEIKHKEIDEGGGSGVKYETTKQTPLVVQ